MIKWNKRLALGLVAAPVMILGAAALPALAAGTASGPATTTQSDGYGPGYGYGMGPAMMGGFGAYGGWGVNPQLSDAQRTKLVGIEKALFEKQWPLMQSMQKVMFESWGQAVGSKLDVDAIMKRATALSNVRLQMLRNRLEAATQIDAVLTPQQRESLGDAP